MKKVNVIKNLKLFFLVAIVSIGATSYKAQSNWYHYDWRDQSKSYIDSLCQYHYNYIIQNYKNNIYIGGQYQKFAMGEKLSLYDDYNRGDVYHSLNGYEAYVKKILTMVVGDTAITNRIRISFYRSEIFNSSMSSSGLLQINVGLLASINTEAELALILSHEVAHFLNQDALKNYGKYMELQHPIKPSFGWIPGVGIPLTIIIGALNDYGSKAGYYWFSREQETIADKYSIELIRKSPYSLTSASNALRAIKRIEIRNEIMYGKGKKTFVSHPDPGQRLSMAKQMDNGKNVSKEDFVVDSLAFVELKEICFQESINIGLVNNNLENLTSLTFSRYLLDPENKENLAVLIETLRRTLMIGKDHDIYKKSFILSAYQTTAVAGSSNYAFLNELNPSILNHLRSGFVNIWKEDFNKIKAKDLLDTTVTEFTSYMEAYIYFKEKAKIQNNLLATHYNYFGEHQNRADEYVKANYLFQTNDYLKRNEEKIPGKKNLILLIPPPAGDMVELSPVMDLSKYLQQTQALAQEMKMRMNETITTYDKLSGKEKHLLQGLFNAESFFLQPLPGTAEKRTDINWAELFPESYNFFTMNGIENLYVYQLNLGNNDELITYCLKISLPVKGLTTFFGKKKVTSLMKGKATYVDFKSLSKGMYEFYTLSAK